MIPATVTSSAYRKKSHLFFIGFLIYPSESYKTPANLSIFGRHPNATPTPPDRRRNSAHHLSDHESYHHQEASFLQHPYTPLSPTEITTHSPLPPSPKHQIPRQKAITSLSHENFPASKPPNPPKPLPTTPFTSHISETICALLSITFQMQGPRHEPPFASICLTSNCKPARAFSPQRRPLTNPPKTIKLQGLTMSRDDEQ